VFTTFAPQAIRKANLVLFPPPSAHQKDGYLHGGFWFWCVFGVFVLLLFALKILVWCFVAAGVWLGQLVVWPSQAVGTVLGMALGRSDRRGRGQDDRATRNAPQGRLCNPSHAGMRSDPSLCHPHHCRRDNETLTRRAQHRLESRGHVETTDEMRDGWPYMH
jgi:hypothetical protein